MGDFVFPSVPGYADVLDASFVFFPWPETLRRVLAVSSGPPGNVRVACVLLAEPLKVTAGEQAAADPRVTSSWGLSEFQPPSRRLAVVPAASPRGAAPSALGRRTQNCCVLRLWGSWVRLSRHQHSYLIWFSSEQSVGGLAAFRAFLKSEYSEENIEFWVSCEDYKKIKSPAKLSPKARKIYDEFISVQATKEVCAQNISWAKVSPWVPNQASSTGE